MSRYTVRACVYVRLPAGDGGGVGEEEWCMYIRKEARGNGMEGEEPKSYFTERA